MDPGLDTGRLDRELRALRAAARWAAADPERVHAGIARVDLADADSWLREWTAAGGAAWVAARREQRSEAFHHAASYYGAALALIDESDGTVEEDALWRRQRECWDRAVAGLGGERVAIAYETTTLPAYFLTGGAGRRPVIVIDPGGRMVTSQAWAHVGAQARERGCHVLIFDGPGRQAALWLGGLVLRPDWEAVVTPIAEWLLARNEVEASRMAIIGLEFGALGIARALGFEHRFAAAALVPGILDGARPWLAGLPRGARRALLEADPDVFEREMHLASLFEPELPGRLRRNARWFDRDGVPLYELYQRIRRFRVGQETGRITTPIAVTEPSDAGPWSGQASELARELPAGRLVSGLHADDAIASWLDALCDSFSARVSPTRCEPLPISPESGVMWSAK